MDEERENILRWDKLQSEKPEDTLLNKPLRFLWAIKELILLFRVFVWHKKRSLRASRMHIDDRLSNISRELKVIEEYTESETIKDHTKRSRENIQDIYEELELKSNRRYRDMPYDKIKDFEDEDTN